MTRGITMAAKIRTEAKRLTYMSKRDAGFRSGGGRYQRKFSA
jgi:hypothetical protein